MKVIEIECTERTEGVDDGVTKLERWVNAKGTHARRHEFTAINEINASEEQAAQGTVTHFQFNCSIHAAALMRQWMALNES